jgi:hypothetical protein
MTDAWLQERPHLATLARSLQTVLELADELYQRGRGSGESVDYSEFEERVAHAAAEVDRGVQGSAPRSAQRTRCRRAVHSCLGQALSSRASHRANVLELARFGGQRTVLRNWRRRRPFSKSQRCEEALGDGVVPAVPFAAHAAFGGCPGHPAEQPSRI